jgi:hypothetical protein
MLVKISSDEFSNSEELIDFLGLAQVSANLPALFGYE